MAGRPRKYGVPRGKGGRILTSYNVERKEATDRAAMDVVKDQRRRHFGAVEADDPRNGKTRSHANDRRYGYAMGRLAISGHITMQEHDAGLAFAQMHADYRAVTGAPSAIIPCIECAHEARPIAGTFSEARAEAIKRRYGDARTAIQKASRADGAGLAIFECVYDVAIRDIEYPASRQEWRYFVKLGLAALARHFASPANFRGHLRQGAG